MLLLLVENTKLNLNDLIKNYNSNNLTEEDYARLEEDLYEDELEYVKHKRIKNKLNEDDYVK